MNKHRDENMENVDGGENMTCGSRRKTEKKNTWKRTDVGVRPKGSPVPHPFPASLSLSCLSVCFSAPRTDVVTTSATLDQE